MYHDIANDIIAKINDGTFDVKLPTEQELTSQYEVSRNTIRRAIDVVYQRGLLRRVQGSGYYVNNQPSASKAIMNLSIGTGLAMHSPDSKLTSKVVTFDKIRVTHAEARLMRVADNTEMWRVVRVRYLDDEIYNLEHSYYPTSVVPVLTVDAVNDSIFEFLDETYDIQPTSSEDYVSIEALTADQASPLGQQPGEKVLALSQLNFCGNGLFFNYSISQYVYPGMRFYFHAANLSSN
ncbi:GntR family transcriptional regulator [Lacticaseibacillus pabuli]|uniref:GntR family transcriptional regulator n=1 Tax=Lacticaseibacillus pabuli TaxID=3025672 RepID=A0ABY7WUA8_9LACO|nr:GntR family transcriptional regulator [Lacticaseibacillus sp. KACC 23028]WDF82581.1 GntR family transcriptional regulator [Lacticaseibacillus sp. KACC 23028]